MDPAAHQDSTSRGLFKSVVEECFLENIVMRRHHIKVTGCNLAARIQLNGGTSNEDGPLEAGPFNRFAYFGEESQCFFKFGSICGQGASLTSPQ